MSSIKYRCYGWCIITTLELNLLAIKHCYRRIGRTLSINCNYLVYILRESSIDEPLSNSYRSVIAFQFNIFLKVHPMSCKNA